ncbi:hypothetical protein E2C01_007556 [Portunus trituberculatus]|uniref:Uncharacterized protein n=1 Tax=Portunus trituberculatus TaxID=210409 RepID=A0A5B7CYH1_PORTR|nr:hypothetical protein [Portunus trituberculatus]
MFMECALPGACVEQVTLGGHREGVGVRARQLPGGYYEEQNCLPPRPAAPRLRDLPAVHLHVANYVSLPLPFPLWPLPTKYLTTSPATASRSRSSRRFTGLSATQDSPSVHIEFLHRVLNSSSQQRIPSIHITSQLTAPLHRRAAPSHIHHSPPPLTSPHTNTLYLTLLTLPQDPRRALRRTGAG